MNINITPIEFNFTYRHNHLKYVGPKNNQYVKDVDEYYEIDTLDKPFYFIVDNINKTLTLKEITNFPKGPMDQNMSFRLWEESYTDIILPGKVEIIHKETLVRSVRYKKSSDSFNLSHLDVYTFDDETLKKWKPDVYFTYDLKPSLVGRLDTVYKRISDALPDKKVYFRPNTKKAFEESNTIQYDIFNRSDVINFENNEETWLVFSKTHKDKIGLASNYKSACALLAEWKFNGTIPYFTCGVSLFEDYYFMPLMYKNITIEGLDEVILSRPIHLSSI